MEALAVLITGPLLGVEFGVAAFTNPMLDRLPDLAFAQARSHSSRLLGKVMPFWYAAATIAMVAAAVLTGGNPLIIAALVLMAVVMGVTLAVMVPINNRIGAWAAPSDRVPADRELAARWDRLHWLRVGLLVPMFVLLVVSRFG